MRFFVTILLFSSVKVFAVGKTANIGFASGNDRFSDTTGGQTDLRAGSGLYFSGGAIFTVTPTYPHRFEFQTSIGFSFLDDQKVPKSEVRFHTIPIEVLYFYRNTRENFRLGYGVQYQVGGKIAGKGINSAVDSEINPSLGYVLAAEKLWPLANKGDYGGFGVRMVYIDYRLSAYGKVLNANSVLATLSWYSF